MADPFDDRAADEYGRVRAALRIGSEGVSLAKVIDHLLDIVRDRIQRSTVADEAVSGREGRDSRGELISDFTLAAARVLGISRRALYRRSAELTWDCEQFGARVIHRYRVDSAGLWVSSINRSLLMASLVTLAAFVRTYEEWSLFGAHDVVLRSRLLKGIRGRSFEPDKGGPD